jgi:hypothetical protein
MDVCFFISDRNAELSARFPATLQDINNLAKRTNFTVKKIFGCRNSRRGVLPGGFFYAIKIVAKAPELRTNKRELRFFERR